MNRLPTEKRAKILNLLIHGMSMRAIEDVEGVSINTVARLLHRAGRACALYHLQNVRRIPDVRLIQCDELWSFIYAKDRSLDWARPWDTAGTVWTFTALDTATRLLVSYCVRERRNTVSAKMLMRDLKGRLDKRPILVADKLKAYRKAAKEVFGKKVRLSQKKSDPKTGFTTCHVERHNLTIRMENRRYARKTNAFSKKLRKHEAMMHLFAVYYNYCRRHKTLRVTPAMEAGLDDTLRDCEWIVGLIDDLTPKPKKPGRKPKPRN